MKNISHLVKLLVICGMIVILLVFILIINAFFSWGNLKSFIGFSQNPVWELILPTILGNLKIFGSQLLLGLALIGGAQILLLLTKKNLKR